MAWKKVYVADKEDVVYETMPVRSVGWHRYADVMVPLITLPLLIVIGLILHSCIVDSGSESAELRWKIFVLGLLMLAVSFIVFCYVCCRLTVLLGGRRSRVHLPIIRNNRRNGFMKSVNSNLQLILPFNNHTQPMYDAVVFPYPPCYTSVTTEQERYKAIP